MGYGNKSPFVRAWNRLWTVLWKGFICLVLGPGLMFIDIGSGTSYFDLAFQSVEGNLDINLWLIHIEWSNTRTLAFVFSAILSAIQIMLWNFVKANPLSVMKDGLTKRNPKAIVAMLAGVILLACDIAADAGGAVIWVGAGNGEGNIWPIDGMMYQYIGVIVAVVASVCNEALLDWFYGADKPIGMNIGRPSKKEDSVFMKPRGFMAS